VEKFAYVTTLVLMTGLTSALQRFWGGWKTVGKTEEKK
jgi:hypothetical protein